MQVKASIYVGERQQPREVVDAPGTLRDQNDLPVDIVIEDISISGFKCRCDQDVSFGSHVRIGLPGVGMRFARFVRKQEREYGFEFTSPLSQAELATFGGSSIVVGAFDRLPSGDTSVEAAAEHRLPIAARAWSIIGASVLLWTGIVVAAMKAFG